MSPFAEPEKTVSPTVRSFTQGMAAVILFYGTLFGWALLQTGTSAEKTLTFKPVTIKIEKPASSLSPPAPDPTANAQSVHAETKTAAGHSQMPHNALSSSPSEEQPHETLLSENALPEVSPEGLYEKTKDGKIPLIRTKDKMSVFSAYRRPFDWAIAGGKPIVSLVIVDMGLSPAAAEAALKDMPPEVSFAFSPYASGHEFWVSESRARGHEVWLSVPMEPKDYPNTDTGGYTLLTGAPERELRGRLSWLMARATGITGFVTPADPTYMQSPQDVRAALSFIFSRGMGVIDGSMSPDGIAADFSSGMKAPYGKIDAWVDNTESISAMEKTLAMLEEKAKTEGSAAGAIRPLPLSYETVRKWLKTLPDKGILLAPLSAQTGQ